MRIGIPVRSSISNGKDVYLLYKRYLDSFDDCEVVLLMPEQSEIILDICDCFLLPGGDDLNPKLYNQENDNCNGIDDFIDALDFKIIRHAYLNNKKILGICRGIQSVNVFFGGTLIQHIDNHMEVSHKIFKVNSSILELPESIVVNSYHHQVVGELGEGLIVSYDDECGVPEIIEHKNGKIICVQFHPEINIDLHSKTIFNFLITM
ncbi:MAG: gamma-glutamyl-gamma-aminobutyrate hydrolase family protein [bacterium]